MHGGYDVICFGGGDEEGYDGDVIYVCVLEEGGGGHCIYVGLAQT